MIKIDFPKASIDAWVEKAKGKTKEFAVEFLQDMSEEIIRNTPVKTGFLRASWHANLNSEPAPTPAMETQPKATAKPQHTAHSSPHQPPAKPKVKLTPTEKAYLDSYSGDEFLKLNQKLRNGENGGSATAKIDSAISKNTLESGTKLYRGISKDALKKLVGGEINVGQIFSDAAFLSTSTSRNIAHMNSVGGVLIEIEVGEGQHGLDISQISRNIHEKEVLLPRNSKMKVIGLRAPKHPGGPIIVRVSTER